MLKPTVKFLGAASFVTLTLICSSIAVRADLNAGLVAHYPFNGNADDATGGGRDGSVYGAILTPDRFGTGDSAYHFDGVGNYISTYADGLPTGERTVALWFRADSLDSKPLMIGYGGASCSGAPGTSWFMGVNAGNVPGFYMSSHWLTNTIRFDDCNPLPGDWTHFAAATDTAGTRLYVNGLLVAQNANFVTNTIVAGTQLGIGVASGPCGNVPFTDGNIGFFKGDLDDIRIYDRALSPMELQELADGAAPINCCASDPAGGCRLPGATKGLLKIKTKIGDAAKNQLQWKWRKGAMTTKAEFGNPTVAEWYALCVYDNGALVSTTRIQAGGVCAGKPCWKESAKGYQFKDKELTPNGAAQLQLKEGLVDGKAKVQFKGKGALLQFPPPDGLTGPVIVQLHQASGTACWGATFSAPFTKQDSANFLDNSD